MEEKEGVNLEKFCGYDYLLDEVDDRVNMEKIHIMLHENRIDVKAILDSRNILPNETAKFNHIIELIKFNYHINIYKTILYLIEDGHDMRRLISVLDPDTRQKLETEMKDIYRIRGREVDDEVGLDDFLS